MRPAATPEDLDVLLEDACVLRDAGAVSRLFEDDAVLLIDGDHEHRGRPGIDHAAADLFRRGYVSDTRHILQSRDTALIVGTSAVAIARRSPNGSWRYAIALLGAGPPG